MATKQQMTTSIFGLFGTGLAREKGKLTEMIKCFYPCGYHSKTHLHTIWD